MTDTDIKRRCPHCRHALPPVAPGPGTPADAKPASGGIVICPYCAEVGVFDENTKLRKATETELEEFELNEDYRVARVRIRREMREHDDRHQHVLGLLLSVGSDGEITVEGGSKEMPTQLQDMISNVMKSLRVRMIGEDIKENITPEIAHHVLSAYGNEQATMPSVAVGALISLIRLCNEMDDHLLSQLNDAEGIHGYVLAVTYLAENPPEGIEMLEMIAGLFDPLEKEQK